MELEKIEKTTHLPHRESNNYGLLMGIVVIIGAFVGILCGSVGIFSGFLMIGICGKLLIHHKNKIQRQ